MFFGPKLFWGEPPNFEILDLVFKTAAISDHVAKFRGDRPRDRGDLMMNKKRNSSKTGHVCVITQRAALKSVAEVITNFVFVFVRCRSCWFKFPVLLIIVF